MNAPISWNYAIGNVKFQVSITLHIKWCEVVTVLSSLKKPEHILFHNLFCLPSNIAFKHKHVLVRNFEGTLFEWIEENYKGASRYLQK